MNRTLFIVIIIFLNIVFDQISKVIVRSEIAYREVIEVISDKFILTNVENTGAFLGMGSDLGPTVKLIFLLILPVIVLSYVLYHVIKNTSLDQLSLIAFCCIIGGGISNVFDRIAFGSVTDFLHIDLGGAIRTGIFNIADMSVTFGMIVLLYASFKNNKHRKAENETVVTEVE
ncbi:signal peptidase II [Flavobacteriaceae bacterium MAR_2010_188]|nr:signal peptidase II [Flavobacteriaceae bacterium MAR_2010_188]